MHLMVSVTTICHLGRRNVPAVLGAPPDIAPALLPTPPDNFRGAPVLGAVMKEVAAVLVVNDRKMRRHQVCGASFARG
jgi:hypothetical protein